MPYTFPMNTLLLLLTLLLPASATAKESAFEQAQECANGKCWLKKGPDGAVVTAPKGGGPRGNLTNSDPKKLKVEGKAPPKPSEKRESGGGEPGFLSKAWTFLKPGAGMLAGGISGAVVGGMMAGFPGALLGAAAGAVIGLFAQIFISSKLK